MNLKTRFPVSYRLGYNAGRARGFTAGKEAGLQQRMQGVQTIEKVVQATEEVHVPDDAGPKEQPVDSTIQARSQSADSGAVKEASDRDANGVRVLIISVERLPSYQIGIRQPLSLLQAQGHCNFELVSKHDVTDAHVAAADMVIVQRSVEPHEYRYFEQARKQGKRTVYVIDDNYAELPPTSPKSEYYADPDRRQTFADFIKHADIVKVDSPYFGKLLTEDYGANVVYFPASFDFSLIDQEEKRRKRDDTLIIGYEGTNKEEDFEPVVPALLRLLEKYDKAIRLAFHGFVPERLKDHPSVSFEPAETDYGTFIRRLYHSNWDIGIAPLADTPYNRCKTNNKFREYAACEVPGIYSATPAYEDWVIQGETGLIVSHSEEGWYEGIKKLIEDQPLREKIKELAEIEARMQFSIDACARQWRKKILG